LYKIQDKMAEDIVVETEKTDTAEQVVVDTASETNNQSTDIDATTTSSEALVGDWANMDKEVEPKEVGDKKGEASDDSEFTLFGEEEEADPSKATPSADTKRDYSKFKEALGEDEDINDDNVLLDKIKGLKSKERAQIIVSTANERFHQDEQVQNWLSWLNTDEDELLERVLVIQDKYSEEDAKEKVLELKDTDPKEYRARINRTKESLKDLLSTKANEIKSEVEEASKLLKTVNPNEVDIKVLKSASDKASKIEEFAGLKLGINDKNREEFLKPVKQLIESGSIIKDLKTNPDLLAEVAFYLHNKKQITSAISNRFYPKSKYVEALDKAPHSSGKAKPAAARRSMVDTGSQDFSGF